MEVKGRKFVVLYLTDWQIRMVKDFLGIECHVWTVPIGDGPVMKYGVFPPPSSFTKKMYLTDWQIREIRAETGECCDYIELELKMIPIYSVVLPEKFIELEKKPLKVKLTDYQKKSLAKIIGEDKNYVEISLVDKTWVMYRVAPDKQKQLQEVKATILEFTDAQKNEIKEALGITCDFIEIDRSVKAF